MLPPLPIDGAIDNIRASLNASRAVVVVAAPGAGKTTRVPPALLDSGPAILLQPRRVAARSIAQRIASERGWTIGREVGWQIRFETKASRETRLLVATEGILTARLQQDPLLSDFNTIVLDEFHERSIHADLGLALARQAWRARTDLRLVVMSATLDAQPVSAFLDGCPVIEVPGTLHPLTIDYAPGQRVDDAVQDLLAITTGDVLCFLPGAREIAQAASALETRLAGQVDVCQLHGSLDAADQDRVLNPVSRPRRRIVVATNLAETSVTVPGVHAVVDSGLQKVARYDADRAIDSLVTERISQDAADQRAGRAARLGPGRTVRLWSAKDRLRPHREADIHRLDLSSVVLDIAAWGGDPAAFEWFEAPRADRLQASLSLLERLGAIRAQRVTSLGQRMQRVPLPPRLARILIEGEGHRDLARACALLSERQFLPPRAATTTSDLLSALDDWNRQPPHMQRIAREIEQTSVAVLSMSKDGFNRAGASPMSEAAFRRALLAGYPDRVAQRRAPGSARVKLATGAGAAVAPESGVRDGEFLIAIDLQASTRTDDPDARVRIASRVEREWLTPTSTETLHRVDDDGRIRASVIERYDELVLANHPAAADAETAARLLAAAWRDAPRSEAEAQLLRRVKFAQCEIDLDRIALDAAYGVQRVADIDVAAHLGRELTLRLDKDAPESLVVPSGRSTRLEYADDGSVSASVKLQELFGLAETPRVGPKREPVRLALLAPNGRPVQVTRDLRSFWDRTYPEVRKELRGRYPKHPWPEDPWNAPPTARTVRKPRT